MCESRNKFQGGWGPGLAARKQSGQRFFSLFFSSPQLILQVTEEVQWFYYRENNTFPRIQRGSNIFWGVQPFSWGCPNAYFYRNSYKLRFSRGGIRTPYPPLDLHMHKCAVGLIDMGGGGGSTFSWGGVQMLIPAETHITCDFPKGGV